jgi:hypothetical protein
MVGAFGCTRGPVSEHLLAFNNSVLVVAACKAFGAMTSQRHVYSPQQRVRDAMSAVGLYNMHMHA